MKEDVGFLQEEGFVGVSGRTGLVLHDPVYGEQQYVGRSTGETSELPLFCWRPLGVDIDYVFLIETSVRKAYARLKQAVYALLLAPPLSPTEEDLALLRRKGFQEEHLAGQEDIPAWRTDEEGVFLFYHRGWVHTSMPEYVKNTSIRFSSVREFLLFKEACRHLDSSAQKIHDLMKEHGLAGLRHERSEGRRYVLFYFDSPDSSILEKLRVDLYTMEGLYSRHLLFEVGEVLDMTDPASWCRLAAFSQKHQLLW